MKSLGLALLFVGAVGLWLACRSVVASDAQRPAAERPFSISQAVKRALRGREAIVLVGSARSGRLLATNDLRDARRLRLLPGSAIKPWTALALLRAGVVSRADRIECRRIVPAYGPRFACTHPPLGRPIGIRTALAVSCNYFFLTESQRLPRNIWLNTLARYGLRPDSDSRGRNLPLMAIGVEGIHLTAWNLFQAWRRLVWRMSRSNDPALRLVREGLIECVRGGTGQPAQVPGWEVMGKTGTAAEIPDGRTHAWFLAAAPAENPRILLLVATARGSGEHDAAAIAGRLLRVILPQRSIASSTEGNSPASFRASPNGDGKKSETASVAPRVREVDVRGVRQEPGKIVVELAGPLSALRMEVQSRSGIEFRSGAVVWQSKGANVTTGAGGWSVRSGEGGFQARGPAIDLKSAAAIEIRMGSRTLLSPGDVILRRGPEGYQVLARMGMEEYVAGVVSGEASDMPYAAQQAMAVLARTWARSHRGRHRQQGFDFCTKTHCQVWRWANESSAAWRAAISTHGEEINYHGRPAQVLYSANCGGETEAGGPPWTTRPEPYLVVQADPYCLRHPRLWHFRIAKTELARWLVREGLFENRPADLRIEVTQRDRSGRAVWLKISGPPTRMVNADSFRFDVDRSFGWNRIESTLFTVREAHGYVIFSGRGLGHGVGLCQAGASAMARQGQGWRAIVAHYFPGTQIVERPERKRLQSGRVYPEEPARGSWAAKFQLTSYRSSVAHRQSSPVRWQFVAEGGCRIRFDGPQPREVIEMCPKLLRRAESLLARQAKGGIDLVVFATPADFIRETGEPGWKAAVTRGHTIRLQPESWLERRGRLEAVLEHELLLAVMQGWLRPGVDACRQEGLVLDLTGEGARMKTAKSETNPNDKTLNAQLLRAQSANGFQSALAACYQQAQEGLRRYGRRGYLDRLLH